MGLGHLPAFVAKIAQGMGNIKRARKTYGKSAHYWREEMTPTRILT